MNWARKEARVPLLEFPYLTADCMSYKHLVDALLRQNSNYQVVEQHTRAALRKSPQGGEAYLRATVSKERRKELRRQLRRLSEFEGFAVRRLLSPHDVELWIKQFLSLEQKGWKGRARSAVANNADNALYFESVCREAFRQGSLRMLGLYLQDVPIAMKCSLVSGGRGFALKIAYDEKYKKYSPGVLLEMQLIEDVHSRDGDIQIFDSCAIAGHSMINGLWRERILIQLMLISTGARGDFYLASFVLIRAVRRLFRSMNVRSVR